MNMPNVEAGGPYRFTEDDLAPARLMLGAECTLADFSQWRDTHPDKIASHIIAHTEALQATVADYRPSIRLRRLVLPDERRAFKKRQLEREVGFFCIYNMAEIPAEEEIDTFRETPVGQMLLDEKVFIGDDGVGTLLGAIERNVPALEGVKEVTQLGEQLRRLHRILPEDVVREGGLAKAAMMVAGILTIGAYDTQYEPASVQREHLTRILPAAYAYAATYPIIDDTLEDGGYVSAQDREQYHQAILHGLRTGGQINPSTMPDHPLAEELERAYAILLDTFPFTDYRHFYHAGESMFLSQERDSNRTVESVALNGLRSLYPDIFIKAAMTRIIANIIGQRKLTSDFYRRAINATFLNQFRDDLFDRRADQRAGRLTPFTYEGPTESDVDPLYDLFAYSAYTASQIFKDDPRISGVLTDHNAAKLAVYLRADPEFTEAAMCSPTTTPEMATFLEIASKLSQGIVDSPHLLPRDLRLQKAGSTAFRSLPPTEVDPRTFVSDRLGYINQVVTDYYANREGILNTVAYYMLESGGKRLRPALTLMLAEGLGIKPESISELLIAIEQYHTASLIFDDLPAQDGAQKRRGRPSAHIAFNEADAQLAGISMISQGFGVLRGLAKHYPADVVLQITEYLGTIMGPEGLCRGQTIDLHMERGNRNETTADIIEMYRLKTATLIEASLIPLMMLAGRSQTEIELIKQYADHAGIAFQIRDDILDIAGDTEALGKDTESDTRKVNLARQYGTKYAEAVMREHLEQAIECCTRLPFNTNLLQGIVAYFVNRNR